MTPNSQLPLTSTARVPADHSPATIGAPKISNQQVHSDPQAVFGLNDAKGGPSTQQWLPAQLQSQKADTEGRHQNIEQTRGSELKARPSHKLFSKERNNTGIINLNSQNLNA